MPFDGLRGGQMAQRHQGPSDPARDIDLAWTANEAARCEGSRAESVVEDGRRHRVSGVGSEDAH